MCICTRGSRSSGLRLPSARQDDDDDGRYDEGQASGYREGERLTQQEATDNDGRQRFEAPRIEVMLDPIRLTEATTIKFVTTVQTTASART